MKDIKSAIGGFGTFTSPQYPLNLQLDTAAELEELGYGALWLGNSTIEQTAQLIAATSTIIAGTAIQSIWAYSAEETAAHYTRIEVRHPGRIVVGLGASHARAVKQYHRPYSAMVDFLDALDAAETPIPADRRVLAALGPKMMELSRDRSAGALPYLVTSDFTAHSRELLGDAPLLAPELGVILESDPDTAREIARGALATYLELTNYVQNWLRLGFTEADVSHGGSNRLVDALFAWGTEERIRSRIAEFRAAGADHIALQVITEHPSPTPPLAQWRRLAAVLQTFR